MPIVTIPLLLRCVHHSPPFNLPKFAVKAVLIDLDGTLIHTAPEIARSANLMLEGLGKAALSTDIVEGFIGEGAITLIERCLANQFGDIDDGLLAQAKTHFFAAYANIVTESAPYSDALLSLQAMQAAGFKLACVTNKPTSFTLPLLEKSGLLEYFDVVVCGDTLTKKKPDPEQIYYVCEQLALNVQEVVMIGDSKTDVAAARNAGCYVFVVPYGYNQGVMIKAHEVDAIVHTLFDATNIIEYKH